MPGGREVVVARDGADLAFAEIRPRRHLQSFCFNVPAVDRLQVIYQLTGPLEVLIDDRATRPQQHLVSQDRRPARRFWPLGRSRVAGRDWSVAVEPASVIGVDGANRPGHCALELLQVRCRSSRFSPA